MFAGGHGGCSDPARISTLAVPGLGGMFASRNPMDLSYDKARFLCLWKGTGPGVPSICSLVRRGEPNLHAGGTGDGQAPPVEIQGESTA